MSLFPILLEGSGSAETESFASYLHRLAFEHGVYVGELTRYVLRANLISQSPRSFYQKPQELVRPSLTTKTLLTSVQSSTAQPLMGSFLWFLDQPLSLSAEEVSPGFRWCPDCFSEMAAVGQDPHFKLIWHMSAIVQCPVHGLALEGLCPRCLADQETYVKKYPLDRCQHCGSFLRERADADQKAEPCASWHREGSDIVRLFHDLVGCPPGSLPDQGAKISLDRIFDHFWRHDMEDQLYSLIPRDMLLSALHAEETMSLTLARRFAYQLGVPLISLISGEAHQCSGVLSASWTCEIQPSFMKIRQKQSHNHQSIKKSLLRYARSKKLPPSVPELAKRLGMSLGYLEYRFAPIVEKLRTKRRSMLHDERQKKLLFARSAAAEYFFEEMEGRASLSRKQAYRELKTKTGLPKWVLKDAIQEVYATLQD